MKPQLRFKLSIILASCLLVSNIVFFVYTTQAQNREEFGLGSVVALTEIASDALITYQGPPNENAGQSFGDSRSRFQPSPGASILTVGAGRTPTAVPDILVGDGVDDIDVVPTANKVYWHDEIPCSPARGSGSAAASTTYEEIRRIPGASGPSRILFQQVIDPVGCTPHEVRSGIAADTSHVFWFNDSGLYRLASNANVGDVPELVTSDISGTCCEIAVIDDYIFALTGSLSSGSIWRIDKQTGSWSPVVLAAPGLNKLAADDTYVYWLQGDLLYRRAVAATGNTLMASGVDAFYPDLERQVCIAGCLTFNNIYYSKGDELWRYDSVYDTHSLLHTAAAGRAITHITGDNDNIYFFDAVQTTCGPVICFDQYALHRLSLSGGTPTLLYAHAGLQFPQEIHSDGSYLFWRLYDQSGSFANQLWRLPVNGSAAQLTNMFVNDMEITQAIQDENNAVLLVENRKTAVRVMAGADGSDVDNVTAHLYGSWSGGGGGPLLPVNGVYQKVKSVTPSLATFEGFIFELPMNWTTNGSLTLTVALNPYGSPPEPNYSDNDVTYGPFDFQPSAWLPARFVAFTYNDPVTGNFIQPDDEDIPQAVSLLRRMFPLASTPGDFNVPSPGFRPDVIELFVEGMGAWANGTAFDCQLLYGPDDLNQCGPAFAISTMSVLQLSVEGIPLGPGTPWYGFVPGDNVRGFATGRFAAARSWDEVAAVHEVGHMLGRNHPFAGSIDDTGVCGNGMEDGPYDTGYPYTNSALWSSGYPLTAGFDVGDTSLGISRAVKPWYLWNDIMGYCGNQWISDYTYLALFNYLNANYPPPPGRFPAPQRPSGDYLVVAGNILSDTNGAVLHHVERHTTVNTIPPLDPGRYSIRLVDGGGVELAEYQFNPAGEDAPGLFPFAHVVDWITNTAEIQIVDLNTSGVLTSRAVSANPPIVSNVVFTPTLPGGQTGFLTWAGTDPDGDALTYDVFTSRDNGITFRPVLLDTSGVSTAVDLNEVGGGTVVWRIVGHDGVHTHQSDSVGYSVAPKPPQPNIVSPANGATFPWMQTINFAGTATDLQDGTVAASGLTWKDEHGFVLGNGPTISLNSLPTGANTISLQAINSLGLSATTSIVVNVDDDVSLPGPALDINPALVNWNVAPGTTKLLTATLFIDNPGSGSLDWSATEQAGWLSLSELSGSTPHTMTVTADPAGLPEGTLRLGEVTFTFVGMLGTNETLTVPVQLAVGNATDGNIADFVVNMTGDTSDATPGDGRCDTVPATFPDQECTLRAAIEESNLSSVHNVVHFNIPGSGPHTISLTAPLPVITEAVTLDARSEPGYAGLPLIAVDGSSAGASDGFYITADEVTIRGFSIVNFQYSAIFGYVTRWSVFRDNFLGLGPDGQTPGGNGRNGLTLYQSSANQIQGNRIGSNGWAGIELFGANASWNTIIANDIGIGINRTQHGNGTHGIFVRNGSQNIIGGLTDNQRNIIAYNGEDGISIETITANIAMRNRLQGNHVFANGGLAIDLDNDGVTQNDPTDADGGTHGLQNYPDLDGAISVAPASTQVFGLLDSVPEAIFTLDFYTTAVCDASGHGEAEVYLGSTDVNTDSSGLAAFHVNLSVPTLPGSHVVGVATDASGNSSELSICVAVCPAPVSPVLTTTISGSDVVLGWQDNGANSGGYQIHTDSAPYFLPYSGTLQMTLPPGSESYVDPGAAGNPTGNRFYIVEGVDCSGSVPAASNRRGVFSFAVEPGT